MTDIKSMTIDELKKLMTTLGDTLLLLMMR